MDRINAIESRASMLRVASVGANSGFSTQLATAVDRFGNGMTRISEPQDGTGQSIRLPGPSGDDPTLARIRSGAAAASGISPQAAASAYGTAPGATAATGSGLTPALDATFNRLAAKYGVPAGLAKAVARAESGFRADATSGAGAQGLMQLMPATARGLGVHDPFDPEQNAEGGVKYLRSLLDRFHGDAKLALAGYNAGPNAVAKFGGVPPYAETQAYVTRVLGYARDYGFDDPATTGSTPTIG
jgi:soluble lytic murein transglycosylase-like protein